MNGSSNYFLTIILAASPFGWIGVHHYYVGNKYKSAFYFVFLFTLIPPLLSLIDAFILIYRGQESFIQKHGTDEDLEAYHLRELRKHNPMLAQQVAKEKEEYDLDDIEEESIPDSAAELMKQKQREVYEDEEDSESEQEDKRREKPDYSDYYGDWN